MFLFFFKYNLIEIIVLNESFYKFRAIYTHRRSAFLLNKNKQKKLYFKNLIQYKNIELKLP